MRYCEVTWDDWYGDKIRVLTAKYMYAYLLAHALVAQTTDVTVLLLDQASRGVLWSY